MGEISNSDKRVQCRTGNSNNYFWEEAMVVNWTNLECPRPAISPPFPLRLTDTQLKLPC